MNRIGMLVLAAVSLPLVGAELVSEIPSQFQGRWATSPDACKLGAESVLIFGTNDVKFYEGRGKVLSMAAHGRTQLGLLLEGRSEGETQLVVMNLILSDDENKLWLREGPHLGPPRIRCDK